MCDWGRIGNLGWDVAVGRSGLGEAGIGSGCLVGGRAAPGRGPGCVGRYGCRGGGGASGGASLDGASVGSAVSVGGDRWVGGPVASSVVVSAAGGGGGRGGGGGDAPGPSAVGIAADPVGVAAPAAVVERATSRAVCAAFAQALARYGAPEEVITDNGKQFTDRFSRYGASRGEVLFDKICRKNGITHRLTQPAS